MPGYEMKSSLQGPVDAAILYIKKLIICMMDEISINHKMLCLAMMQKAQDC